MRVIYKTITRNRTNSNVYVQFDRGYILSSNSVKAGRTYLKCLNESQRSGGCPGKGYIKHDDFKSIVVYRAHTCCKTPFLAEVLQAKEDLFTYAREHRDAVPKAVYEAISQRYTPEIMGRIPFSKVESNLKKIRREHHPPSPICFEELVAALEEEDYGRTILRNGPFFREVQTNEELGYHNVIFHSEEGKKALQRSSQISIDSTFRVVPRILGLYQLLTVMAMHGGVAVPVVFILMTRKTESAYVAAFRYLRSLRINPRRIITDAEKAQMSALRTVFPAAKFSVCYFHYTQNVIKKCLRLHMKRLVTTAKGRRILGCILALPLLPHGDLSRGVKQIERMIRKHGCGKFAELLAYVKKQWIEGVGAKNLSVYGCSALRTINNNESYHKQLNKIGLKHPNIWVFLNILRNVENIAAVELAALDEGHEVRRHQKRQFRNNLLRQKRYETDLKLCRIDVLTYLKRSRFQMEGVICRGLNQKQVDEPDDEIIAPPPPLARWNEEIAEENQDVPGAGENIQPDQQQSASSYFASFNPEEDSDEVIPHVDESRLVPPQSSANSRDELLNLMYEEAQEAGPFLANGSAENFPSDVPPHIDESLLSPLHSSVPDDPDELINMMYEGAIQFLTDDSGENFLGDVLPEIDESQLMPPQCSAVQCSPVQSSPVDQDELVKPDKETQEANPAKDSEEPPAVELQDGSETETASESGGEEEINYLELEPSAFDMEKVPYLGKFLTADEIRAGLAALKRQKEIMRAINEIEHKQTRTIFDDHMIPLEEYPGYCDLQAEYQAIQSRLTLDKPGENVPDDYFENFMSPAKSNRKRKFKSKRRSNCKRRR